MSVNRNKLNDRSRTLAKITDNSLYPVTSGRNWLGHTLGSGAHVVDEMLLKGASIEDLRGIQLGSIPYRNYNNHRSHLRETHGILVKVDAAGKHRFDVDDLTKPYQEGVKSKPLAPDAEFGHATQQTSGRRITSGVRKAVWERDRGQCQGCGSTENLEFDHIIPVSRGGGNSMDNIETLCQRCNRSKSASIM